MSSVVVGSEHRLQVGPEQLASGLVKVATEQAEVALRDLSLRAQPLPVPSD